MADNNPLKANIMRGIRLTVILLGVLSYADSWAAAIGVIKPKTETGETIEQPPQTTVPATTAPAEAVNKVPDKSVQSLPDKKDKQTVSAKGMSSSAIWIGAGVAAALAAMGGGGGGGNSSTPQH